MTTTKTLLLLSTLLAATACAPESGDSQYEHGSKNGERGAHATPVIAQSSTSAKGEGSKDAVDAQKGQDQGTPVPSPSQSPGQTPGQTPHQSPVQAVTDPELTVVELATAGSGCPAGTVATDVSLDAKAFTLLFDSFILNYAPADGDLTEELACRVTLKLATPPGWAVTVLSVDWRGFADLTAGAAATLTTRFAFQGGGSGTFADTLTGPVSDNYQSRAEATLATAAWSGCDGTKTLNLDLKAKIAPNGQDPAGLTVDSIDGELKHVYGLAWRRCD